MNGLVHKIKTDIGTERGEPQPDAVSLSMTEKPFPSRNTTLIRRH